MPAPLTRARAGRAAAWLVLGLLLLGGAAAALVALTRAQPAPQRGEPESAPGPAGEPAPAAGLDAEFDPPVPPYEPDPRVYPPDHLRTGRAPTAAIVRGLVVADRDVGFPEIAVVELLPQAAGAAATQTARISPEQPQFRFDAVPFGAWKVRLHAPGYREYVALLSTSVEECDLHLVLPLRYAHVLRGRVFDSAGRSVAHLGVTAQRILDDPARVAPSFRGISDEQGEYRIEDVSPGRYRVQAGDGRSLLGEAREIVLAGAEAWVDLTVPLTGSATLVLTDAGSGAALADIKVVAARMDSSEGGFSASALSGADGRVSFAHLPPGEYAFTAYGAQRRRTVLRGRVEVDLTTELTVAMQPLPPR
ncbi:MAG: carboxypeptidase regulatory-like domain-containing protein [Planctomycetota bacterium]|nr:MAG: carboxypeptidase regulatory-like domain-containing protein [Planctomycetota bacterium]